MVDIDGVISLFGVPDGLAGGSLCTIEGTLHFLSHAAAERLLELREWFELVWASGWEEKAGEHLPHLLGLPADMPFLRFERRSNGAGSVGAHWKLAAIERHAGARALAWVDDSFNDACLTWAAQRQAPTLLVQTEPPRGLTAHQTSLLRSWALGLGRP